MDETLKNEVIKRLIILREKSEYMREPKKKEYEDHIDYVLFFVKNVKSKSQ